MGMGQKIQSGDYELSRAMSATEILDQLISGDGKPLTTTITIIPGWTVEDVARYLVELKILGNTDEFLSLCKSGESYSGYYFIEEMMKTDTVSQRRYALEGYLSPNTYEIYTSSSADTIIKRSADADGSGVSDRIRRTRTGAGHDDGRGHHTGFDDREGSQEERFRQGQRGFP